MLSVIFGWETMEETLITIFGFSTGVTMWNTVKPRYEHALPEKDLLCSYRGYSVKKDATVLYWAHQKWSVIEISIIRLTLLKNFYVYIPSKVPWDLHLSGSRTAETINIHEDFYSSLYRPFCSESASVFWSSGPLSLQTPAIFVEWRFKFRPQLESRKTWCLPWHHLPLASNWGTNLKRNFLKMAHRCCDKTVKDTGCMRIREILVRFGTRVSFISRWTHWTDLFGSHDRFFLDPSVMFFDIFLLLKKRQSLWVIMHDSKRDWYFD